MLLWALASLLLAALFGACAPGEPKERSATGWNVVLVSVDTLRADHLSSYGATELRTEAIDRLAAEGVLFENVSTVAPTTLPAHASLFTGRTPPRHGVRDNVGFYLSPAIPTLASRLRSEGYDTAGFAGAFVLDSRFGIANGFDLWDDELGPLDGAGVAQRRGEDVLESALRFLRGRSSGGRPFFAFLHFYDPHAPYDAPGGDDAARYRGEVAAVDSLVGSLLGRLREQELDERTLVVLTSDHGESLGEHGERTHGYFLYEATLRIPLLLRYPGAPAGERIEGLASLVDVAPTILDLLGLETMPGSEGRSLVPQIEGAPPGATSAYAETFVPRLHYGWSELRALRRDRFKLVLAPRPELYDLESDPDETRNLAGDEPDLASSLESELRDFLDEETPSPAAVDASTRRKLEALGYTAGAGGPRSRGLLADPKERLELYLVLNDPSLEVLEPDDEEFSGALARLEKVVRSEPAVPRAHVLYGDLLLKAGRAVEAEAVFENLVRLAPENGFTGHYGLGVARARQSKWDEAAAALESALALEPLNTKALVQSADVEAERKRWDDAEHLLRRALEVDPDRRLAERLASVLLSAGKASEARSLLGERAEEAPNDPWAHYDLGELLRKAGDLPAAVNAFRRAVSLAPEEAELHHALGSTLLSAGDRDAAVEALESAVTLSPCFAPALSNLGSAYAELGRTSEALQSFERAVACDPGYSIGYRNLAAVYWESGDARSAIESLRKGIRAGAADPELRKTLDELVAYERSRR